MSEMKSRAASVPSYRLSKLSLPNAPYSSSQFHRGRRQIFLQHQFRSRRPSLMESITKLSRRLSQTQMNFFGSSFEDSVFFSEQCEAILADARGLCRDYICYRLKRSGFRGKVVFSRQAPANNQQLSMHLLTAGHQFELRYPHLYRNLARQLGYVITSDEVLRHMFFKLAEKVVGKERSDFTWSRFLSLFCISGALAVDCMTQGHCELIESLVTIFGDFIESSNLVTWVNEHGGWEEMARHYKFVPGSKFNTYDVDKDKDLLLLIFVIIFICFCFAILYMYL